MAIYDFPTVLEKMLRETGNEKIFYIGYSSGGTVYPIAMAELPHLNQRIQASFLLAPAIFIGHANNPMRIVASNFADTGPSGLKLLSFFTRGRILNHFVGSWAASILCTPSVIRCGACGPFLFQSFGYDGAQLNYDTMLNAFSKFLNSFSNKEVLHYAQNYKSCSFRKFDYGTKENLKRYGQTVPPAYNLSLVTGPVYMYFGEADNLVTPRDVAIARDAFAPGSVKGFYKVNWSLFNHIDFVLAKDVGKLVYKGIINTMNELR